MLFCHLRKVSLGNRVPGPSELGGCAKGLRISLDVFLVSTSLPGDGPAGLLASASPFFQTADVASFNPVLQLGSTSRIQPGQEHSPLARENHDRKEQTSRCFSSSVLCFQNRGACGQSIWGKQRQRLWSSSSSRFPV